MGARIILNFPLTDDFLSFIKTNSKILLGVGLSQNPESNRHGVL